MASSTSVRERLLGGLVLLFLVVFAGYVAWQFWPRPQPQPETPKATETVSAVDCTDVGKLAEHHALLGLKDGCVEIAFAPDLAPKHVAQVETLIKRHFYDGIVFHRVIAGFMAQTGDPTGTGTGGSDLPDIAAEFTDTPFVRGTLGMARSADPNSANSQFFITFAPASYLDGQYTVFGKVVSGMEFVDNIKKGDPSDNGMVTDPDKIITFRLAGDTSK